jgi:hypothetical protein
MDNPQVPSPTPSTSSSADSAGDFGAAFKGFLERTVAAAPAAEPVFAARLTPNGCSSSPGTRRYGMGEWVLVQGLVERRCSWAW